MKWPRLGPRGSPLYMADRDGRPLVLTLIDSLSDGTGGAGRFAVGLAQALPADRYSASVCVTRTATGYLPRSLSEAGLPPVELRRRGRLDVLPLRRLGGQLRAGGVDVLHCHKFGSNLWGTLVGRLAGVPAVLAHEHTWSYQGQPLRRLLDGQLIGRLADRL